MQNTASVRLKETLDWWKDLCFVREASVREAYESLPRSVTNYLRRWRSYEDMVLDNGNIKQLDIADWFAKEPLRDFIPALRELDYFPIELFEWNRKSRRVYRINKGLQRMLGAATFPNMRWSDILWPFDAFALELEEPMRIQDETGLWTNYDTILVANIPNPEGELIVVRLLREPHVLGAGKFPANERERIERALRSEKRQNIRRLLSQGTKKQTKDMKLAQGTVWWVLHEETQEAMNAPIRLEVEDVRKKMLELDHSEKSSWQAANMAVILRIVVGLTFYLRTQSGTSKEVPWGWEPGYKGVNAIITNPEYICEVVGKGVMDPATYGLGEGPYENSNLFVRPHWRRAHDRRPPGSGPNAPKSIAMPPMLIRPDLIPLFGIIGGTHTDILPDDWF